MTGSRSIRRIDSGLYRAWIGFKDWWSAYSTFFGRFEARGILRAVNDFACEGLTLGTGGMLVVLAFALPAFDLAQGKMNLSDEYSVTFYDRFGNEIGKRGLLRDNSVPLDELPDFLIKATLATEDRRFFDHFGVDVMGTIRALAENARADAVVQGGSSLTQQLAKNMFLSPERALSRKIKEAFIAVYLENHYTKREILKMYFDRAYLGGGSYGVEAAARFYFGKSIRDVTLAEAAMLAGMFKAPTRYAPHIDMAASRARANEVLTNMVEAGYLTEGQVYGARMSPAKIVERSDYYSPDWFLDWAFEEVQRIMVNRKEHILSARTTVDIGLQKSAEQSLQQTLAQYGRARSFDQGALVGMETGRCGARARRRQGLWREPIQSRDPRSSPAWLLLQGLRLSHRSGERLQADLGGERRLCLLRPLVAEELLRRFPRSHDAGGRASEVDQHHRCEALPRCRPRQGSR